MGFEIKKISASLLKNSFFAPPVTSPFIGGIIMITTPTCTKCKAILADTERLKSILPVGLFVYEFNGEEEGIEVLTNMNIMSAPIMLYIDIDGSRKVFKQISTISDLESFANSLDSVLDN